MPLPPAPTDLSPQRPRAPDAAGDERVREAVLDTAVDVVGWLPALARVRGWAERGESRCVCFCNVHSVVTARWDGMFAAALGQSDLVVPDGAPVAWMLRRLGHAEQRRVYGPDFFWAYCQSAAASGEPIYLLGSSPDTLERLQERLLQAFPPLRIAGAHSPPFRPLSADEDRAIVDSINASGARTVWVSLGCPKQEIWMASHHDAVHAVMLGVGAAFDFHAGTVRQAPRWMREHGLEWLHRLGTEPRRLWRRYLVTNSVFLFLAARQLLLRALKRPGG
jgi:N-acetylglucosaminyldiphosphoundecaprenol N-acetyl-beta-D-mannosaminyltransferase